MNTKYFVVQLAVFSFPIRATIRYENQKEVTSASILKMVILLARFIFLMASPNFRISFLDCEAVRHENKNYNHPKTVMHMQSDTATVISPTSIAVFLKDGMMDSKNSMYCGLLLICIRFMRKA